MDSLVIGSVSAVAAGGGFLAHAVRGRSSQVFGPSVYRGDRGRPVLALTFDDGPSESTPLLLDLLEKHNVRATFFMCGRNVERLPEVARAVMHAGHEIGNHSDSHPRFDFCSREFIYRELSSTQEKIANATGVIPRLFRAPYGVRWFGMSGALRRLHLTGVMWTIIAHDWRWPAGRISKQLEKRGCGGDIICLHDGRTTQPNPEIGATIDALAVAIPTLRKKGLTFDTVSGVTQS